ncbi:MAG: gliding motility-associated-like protein, partial [Ulvibacter sp.]
DGDCSNGDEVWDVNTCTCSQENVPMPCVDDGDCSNGEETWDANTCTCTIIPPVLGCTDPTANNYNPTATCDDGSCTFDCPDPGNCDDGDCANGLEFWDDILCACQPGTPPVDPGCDDGDCTNGEETWDGCDCQPGIPVDCSNGASSETPCDDGDSNTFNDLQTVLDCDGTICIPCMGTPCNVQAFIEDPLSPLTCQSLGNGFILDGNGSSTGTTISYEWIFNNTSIGTAITLEVFEEGVYTLWVRDANGCEDLYELEVIIPIVELNPIFDVNDESCPGEADGNLLIDTVTGGQAPYLFALISNNFTTNNLFENLSPGNYTLTIQDADGCEFQTEIIIAAANPLTVDLGEDDRINLGDSIQLSNSTNVIIDTIIWDFEESLSCLDCQEPIARPLGETTYTLTLIDVNGCSSSDQITIFVDKVRRVFIPNVFSPNDDGLNDYFMIYGGPDVKIVRSFNIYDRWGANVFSATNFTPDDFQARWDGRYLGEKASPGVYTYFAEIEFVDGRTEILAGDLTLVR